MIRDLLGQALYRAAMIIRPKLKDERNELVELRLRVRESSRVLTLLNDYISHHFGSEDAQQLAKYWKDIWEESAANKQSGDAEK